uniref:Voltage-gated hydrogen channel 1 n=1 Tax=Leptocylindrus danicus TaxID=163516 RepID=A0A6U2PDJ5_9STRA|mmetsp:Transcript_2549/g.3712  ORF Transcript_2549/g.3712 Transcript_2549/m.3712 type:complete len:335 (+) Transcript_2549:378-1382(+)|eukprot:CAMPEP_0116011484 /NCGR_PEP_ID=MMETSP0321-20121206/4594_1 /TAXON_ID=163516 /ORGANISM="Leptocylindrus danicus var. danicus, Strain B650" /LENGTH=334 /DNA_ID=CAMNT_0003480723 /DNA_START=371 /DNA_END=1375 /DNA_ORIENTATION=+
MTRISFEEFHAARKRERAQLQALELNEKENQKRETSKKATDEKLETLPKSVTLGSYYSSRLKAAGEFVELFEVQSVIVLLIFLDLVATTSSMLIEITFKDVHENAASRAYIVSSVTTISKILNSASAFALAIFVVELLALCLTFGLRNFLSHPGYFIDLTVISLCILDEGAFSTAPISKFYHVLGFLRLWRLARLVRTALESAWNAHQETRASLDAKNEEAYRLSIELTRTKKSVELEIEARKRVEKMLQGYKDEVETLNEALEIAAYDVMLATAAADQGFENEVDTTTKEIETNLDGDVFYSGEEEISEPLAMNAKGRGAIVILKDGTITRED